MKKKLSIILILIGLAFIAIPITGQILTQYQQKALLEEWVEDDEQEQNTQKQESQPITQKEGQPARDTKTPAKKQVTDSKKTKSSATVLGIMKINKLNLETLVVNGVKKSDLRVGVGLIPGTASIGASGNTAIAGHRSYAFGKFFNRLNELSAGDEIDIVTKGKTYKYKVYSRFIVEPQDTWVLKQNKNEKILTLITCHPIYIATHRLIVQARLEE